MESNIDRYEDKTVEKVVDKKVLNKMIWRSLFLQASFNFERMQAAGWLHGLLPGLEKIHKNKEDLSKSMKQHMEFFNTHPFLVNFIQGIVISMEENKEDISTIRGIKVATMGPLGGIGDALFWLTFLPISAGIGAALALEGQIAGPIIFLVMFNGVQFALRYFLTYYGYKTGVSAISTLKESTQKVSRAATILGLTVVGALIASYINLNLKTVILAGQAKVELQAGVVDKIMPRLLPVCYTFLMLYLIKKKWSPLALIGLTLAVGIIGSYIPNLL
ncbi:MAG: PTS system mannose/fructose/sorbose family transporter subunit IID [Leptotrichiaceae bacterium]|jgi:PTS system N-acetylgalactosamine-specific IID component|nr:PTS system mannose/fructose/sorbose family transporter subunit IID [Leptotrichiaceae bacterium]MBP6280481.1 PTS system mannose/fructose/sorbose family transporter subunit IID [Leptotrichiaceae bacterium]MBP7099926.1 PTS system mannose/fructose/sorbose family transporter subunit IID [Leptotrichiaceae bacterium]MBP7725329.1 PTS system mannose/fructose/sorbose family transporter subunit IID [Leptotrichiaceae bacterium]MBP9629105.1 PTS system mannose/fructose/sorbose family transporter subunit I